MGSITATFATAFRDYVTDGVPASGKNDPVKSEVRAIGPLIEAALGTLSLGSVSVTKDTRAHLNADLAHAADTVALVYADATDVNNDLYVKVGSSGSGSWTLTGILHLAVGGLTAPAIASATAQAVLAGHYANDNVDSDVPGGSAGDRGAKYWATQASTALAGLTKSFDNDTLAGARTLPAPPSRAASVVSDTLVLPSGSDTVATIFLTVDQLAQPTAVMQIVYEIVSGSLGTAFTIALLRWKDASDAQIGADVPMVKTATAISLAQIPPAGAVSFQLHTQPAVSTTVRHLVVSIGNPARPITDPWYLSLVGAAVGSNDPAPATFHVSPFLSPNWSFPLQRIVVPTGGGSVDLLLDKQAFDGDIVWVAFSSPLEPSAWLQNITDRYGASLGKGGSHTTQYFRIGPSRWMVAVFVQSTDAANDFASVRFTWNNATGSATYADNIQCFVGPNPPFLFAAPKVVNTAIDTARTRARGRPVITFAGDSTEDNSDPFAPDPRQALAKRFGDEVVLRDLATPGNTLTQAAVTAGLLPVTVNLSGAYIPASTSPVTITSWPTGYDPMTSLSFTNPNFDPYCWIAGVFGYLSSDGTFSGNSPVASHLFFTPIVAPPYPVEVPNGTPLILRSARESKGSLIVFPISSVNGVGGGFANSVAFVDAVFAAAPDPALLAGFAGLQPGSGTAYPTGATTLASFSAKSYFSRLFDINVMSASAVSEAMSVTGWTWAAGENAAWAAGTLGIPASMRIGDGFHPYTDAGVYVLAKNWRAGAPVAAYIAALN